MAAAPCQLSVSSGLLTTRSGDGLALQLIYRNTGPEICALRGYPTVTALALPNASAVPVPPATTSALGKTVSVRTVSLGSGASGSALVEWSATSHTGGSCPWLGKVTATPPGSSTATVVMRDGLGKVCDAHVLPVVAGTSHANYVPAPRSQTLLGLVVSSTKLADAYRVVLAPAVRQSDGQFVAVAGGARVTFDIPVAIVPDGIDFVGPITVTTRGPQVTSFTIVGG